MISHRRMMFRRGCLLSASVALATLSVPSLASECNLKGVRFSALNPQQIEALRSLGAECTSTTAAVSQEAAKFSDKGFIIFDGKKIDYLDLASETASQIAGKPVEIYGYLYFFSETDPAKAWGFRFDFKMYEGKWLSGLKMMNMTDPKIDIVLAPSRLKKYDEPLIETLNGMRRSAFRALTTAREGKALVKIKGQTSVYSNTLGLYIAADSIEIIR